MGGLILYCFRWLGRWGLRFCRALYDFVVEAHYRIRAPDVRQIFPRGYVRGFLQQFGEEAWFLIYRADVRLRSEQLERIRRALRANPQHGYTEASPWGVCFTAATKDSDFWSKELVTPATLWLSTSKKRATGGDDGATHQDANDETHPKKKKRANRRYTGEDKSRQDNGVYTINRKGVEICRAYNDGKCGSAAAQGKCKNSRSHQCNLCLGPHPAQSCPKRK